MTQEKLAYMALGAILLFLAACLYLYDTRPTFKQAWHQFWYAVPRLPWIGIVLAVGAIRFAGKETYQGKHFAS